MRKRILSWQRGAICLLAICAWPAWAAVTLAPLFTDGVVLQRDKPVAVWGRADPGEKVAVAFGGQLQRTTTAKDGRWVVFLEPLTVSSTGAEMVVAGKNTLTVRDVVVGEVWLCSGQSNMEFAGDFHPAWQEGTRVANAPAEIVAANFPLVRQVRIEPAVAESPAEFVKTSGWESASPQTADGFTAVGYFFAREIHRKLGVPVGLVNCSLDATPIEAWMSPAALASDPAFQVVRERWRQTLAEYPAKKAAHDTWLAEWTAAEAAAKAKGEAAHAAFLKQNPRRRAPRGAGEPWRPTGLFNGMINPLLPYALRGVLWHQGESNAERAAEYHALFAAMITAWRAHFGQGDIPFYWVNLAGFDGSQDATKRYAFLREAQTKTLALPNTGQAITIDLREPHHMHAMNRQEVARRLALLARNRVYGIVGDDTGPAFERSTRENVPSLGLALRVHFKNAESGLVAHDKPVQSLELAGADGVFLPANGKIDRSTLLVWSPAVPEPVAVRYAWQNLPEANLYNGAGLPAAPFRSDAW